MTHKEITALLNQDLDDLKVRNPQAYESIEKRLRRLEIEASFDVSQSPVGTRTMERMK
jgi:hypothetical protein